MKTKSKVAQDLKNRVLERAHLYARNEQHISTTEDSTEYNKINKASEAEKQKKREKMRLKKELKRLAREKSIKKDNKEAKVEGLHYLHLFNSDKYSWSFKKKQQIWLLKNTFDSENISDEDFQILLDYLIDLKGAAKSRLTEECEKAIKTHEENSESTSSEAASVVFERARSILQILV